MDTDYYVDDGWFTDTIVSIKTFYIKNPGSPIDQDVYGALTPGSRSGNYLALVYGHGRMEEVSTRKRSGSSGLVDKKDFDTDVGF